MIGRVETLIEYADQTDRLREVGDGAYGPGSKRSEEERNRFWEKLSECNLDARD